MEITTDLKKKFCKDFAIPISLYDEPYFTDRLVLFDDQFRCLDSWNQFVKMISQYNNAEDYYYYYNKFKQQVIDSIKGNSLFHDFMTYNMNDYEIPQYKFGRKSVFKEDNIGKTLVSIDLTSANFSSMRYFNKELVNNKLSYYEYVSDFTDNEIFKNSKYIRQVIFGNCNPKRQVKIEHYMMNFIMTELLNIIEEKYVQSFMSDEIIFEWNVDVQTKSNLTLLDILNKMTKISELNGFNIHFDIYELQKIYGTDAYIQYKDFGKVNYKCVNPLYYPMILRTQRWLKVTDNDLIFYHEHNLCKFLEVPKIEIGEKNGLYIL